VVQYCYVHNQVHGLEVERLNTAIAEVIFNQDVAVLPVELDLNTEDLSAICRMLEIDPSGFNEFGVDAKGRKGAGTPLEDPPALALLAVLSKAAGVNFLQFQPC
jgi:hypothetical protein